MSKLSFVDAHVHFWDRSHPEIRYGWLEPDFYHPQLQDKLDKLKVGNHLADDFILETKNANVNKVVHVQAALGTPDPVKETQWLQEEAGRTGMPQGIVAYSSLLSPNIESELSRHCEYANMRGIRDKVESYSPEDSYLSNPEWQKGYALLEKFNLVFSLDCVWEDMAPASAVAHKFPNITMVLDHTGFPQERTAEYFYNWREGIRTLAQADNVMCKISGLGMCDQDWTTNSIRPWVLSCIEIFGPERCFFATNWPVDRLFSTYDELIGAYTEIISDFSETEKVAMFSGNSERIYRI